MTAIPAGYVTRARADHLTAIFFKGIREITDRLATRASERCAGLDADAVRTIFEEEAERAVREVEALHADLKARLLASDH